jgi:hypothetical protein
MGGWLGVGPLWSLTLLGRIGTVALVGGLLEGTPLVGFFNRAA